MLGSIDYMSPEQINGNPVDCRTDIFSTGVVLYQLLTNSLPFHGKDTGSTMMKIIKEPPPPLQNFLEVYPAELDSILQRALAKSREERYATAEEFAFDLNQVQNQLQQELVSKSLDAGQDFIARSEFSKAKEQIMQVLKLDRQNRRASELLKETQQLDRTGPATSRRVNCGPWRKRRLPSVSSRMRSDVWTRPSLSIPRIPSCKTYASKPRRRKLGSIKSAMRSGEPSRRNRLASLNLLSLRFKMRSVWTPRTAKLRRCALPSPTKSVSGTASRADP